MSLVICFFAILCLVYIDPILSIELTRLGMPEEDVGFVFALLGGSFAIGSPLAGCLCERVSRQIVLQFGLFAISGSLLLVGPSPLLGLPESLIPIYIGLSFLGFFAAFLFIPVIPEIICAMEKEMGGSSD
jgi:predicted MFS family arabinose efflux permease